MSICCVCLFVPATIKKSVTMMYVYMCVFVCTGYDKAVSNYDVICVCLCVRLCVRLFLAAIKQSVATMYVSVYNICVCLSVYMYVQKIVDIIVVGVVQTA